MQKSILFYAHLKTSKQIRNSYLVQGVIKKINGTFLIYNVTINYKEHLRNIYIQSRAQLVLGRTV
jgi:hypothetical protein